MKVVFDVEYHYYYVLFSPMVMLTSHDGVGARGAHDGPSGHDDGQSGHVTHHEPWYLLYFSLYRSIPVFRSQLVGEIEIFIGWRQIHSKWNQFNGLS